MTTNFSLLKSRTFWTTVATFFVVGGNAILPLLSPGAEVYVVGLLNLATIVFHINPSQVYNQPQN